MILICYGTRPEWIKIKPIVDELRKRNIPHKTLFTGQHKDIVTDKADFNFEIDDRICKNRLNNLVSNLMVMPDEFFDGITHVLIQGDTTSVLSIAINSFHRKIKIIHLEAGLRTYDFNNPYPEEMNRQLVSRIADIHLCPTKNNYDNLIKENCPGLKYIVGNTALDNLKDIETEYTDTVLITLHRRENHDIIDKWFANFSKLAAENRNLKFILPLHPNPNVKKHRNLLKNIEVVDPLSHSELIEMLSKCKIVITDSGGIQEEASFLNKRTIICRNITERPESLESNGILCKYPDDLFEIFEFVKANYEINLECPYGDGNSSIKIVDILSKL